MGPFQLGQFSSHAHLGRGRKLGDPEKSHIDTPHRTHACRADTQRAHGMETRHTHTPYIPHTPTPTHLMHTPHTPHAHTHHTHLMHTRHTRLMHTHHTHASCTHATHTPHAHTRHTHHTHASCMHATHTPHAHTPHTPCTRHIHTLCTHIGACAHSGPDRNAVCFILSRRRYKATHAPHALQYEWMRSFEDLLHIQTLNTTSHTQS